MNKVVNAVVVFGLITIVFGMFLFVGNVIISAKSQKPKLILTGQTPLNGSGQRIERIGYDEWYSNWSMETRDRIKIYSISVLEFEPNGCTPKTLIIVWEPINALQSDRN